MFETHTAITDTILAITAILSTFAAFKALVKTSKKNLIDIVTTIIDDNQRRTYYWYFIINIKNCDKTFKLLFTIDEPFTFLDHWLSSEQFSIHQQTQNSIEILNLTGDDTITLCYKLKPSISKEYLSQLEKEKNIKRIVKYSSDSVRLKLGYQGYSHLHLNVKD